MSGLHADFIAACQEDEVKPAVLVEIKFTAGTARFTTWDTNLTFDGETWVTLGMELDDVQHTTELQITDASLSLDNVEGVVAGYLAANRRSVRGTEINIYLVLADLLANPDYYAPLFSGHVSNAAVSEASVTLSLVSRLLWIQRQGPDRIHSVNCIWTFGGTACGAIVPTANGAADAGSTDEVIVDAVGLGQADDYWAGGYIEFTSGALSGLKRGILSSSQAGTSVTVDWELPAAPDADDTFTVTAGCRKTFADCTKWANTDQFVGFHTIPGMEGTEL